jgi:hypothetical protein
MRRTRFVQKVWFYYLLLSVGLLPLLMASPALAQTAINFNTPGFASTWNRVDKPVQDGTGGARSYTWGPPVSQGQAISSEPYNAGSRQVQYFDKARMEINNPGADPGSLYYVTTGLLVKELVTGLRQDGDNTFTQLLPSTVQVAGDTNEFGGNAIAPTYASFRQLGTFSGTENSAAQASGSPITSRVDKAGNVTSFTPPEQRLLSGYDNVTHHNIADVFVDFANQNGTIYNGTTFEQGPVFFGNPVYVLGRPLTEPYWTRAVVAGVERDVLVQLFERRVLTYTPTNPAGFKVEFGNVGQHYFRWRYGSNSTATPPAVSPLPSPGPVVVTGLQVSPASGYNGTKFTLTGDGFAPNETIQLWETNPRQEVQGLTPVKSDAKGSFSFVYQSYGYLAGTWAITAHGQTSHLEKTGYLKLEAYIPGGPTTVKLSRYQGGVGTSIDIHGENFLRFEPVSFWVTAPDGKVYNGDETYYDHKASGDGQVHLRYVIPEAKVGNWIITVYGQYSTRQATATFNCTG